MKTIIAGSRSCTRPSALAEALLFCGWRPTLVISGMAAGADYLGVKWAEANRVDIRRCPANWNVHGASAGYKRNVLMAEQAEALIALWDGQSKGTAHMITIARERGLRVYVHAIDSPTYRRAPFPDPTD